MTRLLTEKRSSRVFEWTMLLVVLLLTVWKCPALFHRPRFWAEDGTIYFLTAVKEGGLAGLTQHIGYFSIVPNVATFLASTVYLENAPFVVLAFALFFQLATCSVLIFGRSPFWDSHSKKLILACVVTVGTPAEVWLNTISTQHWLCIAVFLILLEPVSHLTPAKAGWYRFLLTIAGLNGITACLLTPFFLHRAWKGRQREQYVQAGILIGVCIFQGCILLSGLAGLGSVKPEYLSGRFAGGSFSFQKFIAVQFVWPFAPWITTNDSFSQLIGDASPVALQVAAVILCICVGTMVVSIARESYRSTRHMYVIGSILIVIVFSAMFAFKGGYGPRYTFAPFVMIVVLLVDLLVGSRKLLLRVASLLLLVLVLGASFSRYTSTSFYRSTLPDWRGEVKMWRQDCSYKPKIWPYRSDFIWELDLPCEKRIRRP